MPNLLELISFGFCCIAHPSQFDNFTGEWIDKIKAISSGAYEASLWDNDNYEIKYRNQDKLYFNKKSLKKIKFSEITKIRNSKDLDNIDFLVADKKITRR